MCIHNLYFEQKLEKYQNFSTDFYFSHGRVLKSEMYGKPFYYLFKQTDILSIRACTKPQQKSKGMHLFQ